MISFYDIYYPRRIIFEFIIIKKSINDFILAEENNKEIAYD